MNYYVELRIKDRVIHTLEVKQGDFDSNEMSKRIDLQHQHPEAKSYIIPIHKEEENE